MEPIGRFTGKLLDAGLVTQAELDEIADAVETEIDAAVESAKAAPEPLPEDALEDVFA